MSRPDWLVPGAEVVVFTPSRSLSVVTPTTIDRVMKRDVVLANGERFNADSLKRRNGDWQPWTELLRADDPRVAQALAANAQRQRHTRARREIEDARDALGWETKATTLDTVIAKLELALTTVREMKDAES